MIVPDTSIWIEFLKQNPVIVPRFNELLMSQRIGTLEPIFAELLYGVRSPRDKSIVQSYWGIVPKLPFEKGALLQAAEYANSNNFHNLGVGLMDAMILIPTLNGKHQFWTLDKKVLNLLAPANRFE